MRFVLSIAAAGLLAHSVVRADHFTVELKVETGKAKLTAHTEAEGFGVIEKKRGVLKVNAGERVTVKWSLKNRDPKKSLKDVLVHFFAVKESELGQKTRPKLDRDVTAESALTMDFNPNDIARGELSLTINKAGPYLLRVETRGAAVGAEGHEHFAALELSVQEP